MKDIIIMQEELVKSVYESNANKLNELFLEGLRLKGYEFDYPNLTESFIRVNCRAEKHKNRTTYYVKDVPFLMHEDPENKFPEIDHLSDNFTLKMDLGKYTHL